MVFICTVLCSFRYLPVGTISLRPPFGRRAGAPWRPKRPANTRQEPARRPGRAARRPRHVAAPRTGIQLRKTHDRATNRHRYLYIVYDRVGWMVGKHAFSVVSSTGSAMDTLLEREGETNRKRARAESKGQIQVLGMWLYIASSLPLLPRKCLHFGLVPFSSGLIWNLVWWQVHSSVCV